MELNSFKKAPFSVIILIISLNQLLLPNVAVAEKLSADETNPYRHSLTLDKNGKYFLEWEVDWNVKKIVFSALVETRGYVGFGLSKKGFMDSADIVIGGVSPDGKPYFRDYYGIGNSPPIMDPSQDWTLHNAWENGSHTLLRFSRLLDTCDFDHDYLIDDNSLAIIWAYGETDNELEYHHQHRGSQPVYLLDPEIVPKSIVPYQVTPEVVVKGGNVQIWRIQDTEVIPAKSTTYICSIYKFTSSTKKHAIGFNPILPTELEQGFTHHFILFRCLLPSDLNPEEVFEPVLGQKEECYILQEPTGRIPTNYCQEQLYVWAVGDLANFLPHHVGIPVGESQTEYYMFQIHFNNQDSLPGLTANYGVEVFATNHLREHDSAVLFSGKLFPASPDIMVPPSSLGHPVYGHCGSQCTKLMIPPEGIKAFSIHLHTHIAGISVRLIHVRNGMELPYISNDDNYFPTYQKSRLFREEHLILPGDQLFMRCIYQNVGRNNTVTVGGFDAVNEMCVASISYYNKIQNRGICGSDTRSKEYREFLRIYNTTWSNEILENVVNSPPKNAGLPVSEVGNRINWTLKMRQELLDIHSYAAQITQCPPLVMEGQPQAQLSREEKTSSSGKVEEKFANSDLLSIQKQFVKTWVSSSPKHFKRSAPGIGLPRRGYYSKYEKEILFPEFEFVSVYEKDVIPWRGPERACPNMKSLHYFDNL